MQFIQKNGDRPFFVYLPFNCPHAPHQVPDEYRQHYQEKDFSAGRASPSSGHPMAAKHDADDLARVYGMIENIDDNVGRLLAKLDELKLADNTIVIIFSDNGCQKHNGYNAGFQGWKGTPFEGGIHQFCFVRWPGQFQAGRRVDRIAAVFDLAPTLLDLCGVAKPERVKFDGRSLAPLLRGQPVAWPDRTLFFQWHRGDAPERYRAFAARSQDWKLVQPLGVAEKWNGKTDFQLYDMAHDPLELHDLAAEQPERVAAAQGGVRRLVQRRHGRAGLQRALADLPRHSAGEPRAAHPAGLARQPAPAGVRKGIGYWEVNVVTAGATISSCGSIRLKTGGEATLTCGGVSARQSVKAGEAEMRVQPASGFPLARPASKPA